ncbi:hypothetical protein B6S44_19525 [Bosea sp. Tri-44]|uniref:hypothetical protein n=1 Tax=Bosea sp. Tri-44 TaxID=1972137 RepID=UPI00100E24D3|nr:hypothetical protein [Bosea sp. Tri-44]RXT52932.1 hypothetical protein B6S44_19525 [Bosea sp. Tri-44]
MVKRKGEVTNKHKNRSHPFQVEIVIPGRGLGNAIGIMYRWAVHYDHETTELSEPGRREIRLMRWCFCSREVADAFATDFGGRRVDLAVDHCALKIDKPDAQELARRAKAQTFGLYELGISGCHNVADR